MKTIGALLVLILTISVSPAQTNAQASNETQSSTDSDVLSLDRDAAIRMYADLEARTVLQHPQLPKVKFSLTNKAQTKEEKTEALETMFREHKIAAIPDGEHFVMLVPFALTNSVTPKAPAIANSDTLLPEMSANLVNAPLEIVLRVYADFLHKQIVNLQDAPRGSVAITFVQTTPLSKQEVCYALETQFAWSNVRLVTDGDKGLKLETAHK